MLVQHLKVDPDKARELWRKYQTHVHYQTQADAEIASIYKRIAQGKTIIRALESIHAAGLNAENLPKLAIARADRTLTYWHPLQNHGRFTSQRHHRSSQKYARSEDLRVEWPGMSEKTGGGRYYYEAQVPLIPIHLRPRRGLANYHILWEAEWTKRYPVDPYLLRRVGGDAWLVVASWDLTDVERAVMSSRLRA